MAQRCVNLAFSATGTRLTVRMPSRASDTPPGFYLLFVIANTGVPSMSKIVRVA